MKGVPVDHDRAEGMLLGLAVGDALGMQVEFLDAGTFEPLSDLGPGGPFNLPSGYWTDDTSMALCLADSILATGGYDSFDVMDRYVAWRRDGYRSSTGRCFDIGNQIAAALSDYVTTPHVPVNHPRTTSAGNGCIMRLAPVVIASIAARNSLQTTMRLAAISARETHYSLLAETATAVFGGMLVAAHQASNKAEVLELPHTGRAHHDEVVTRVRNAASKSAVELDPTGFVLDTMEVATWAFLTTETFEEGALRAVNQGGDADTIGAVYGQLAGAYYGLGGIPDRWVCAVLHNDEIVELAQRLAGVGGFELLRSRFASDSVSVAAEASPGSPNAAELSALLSWSNVGRPGAPPDSSFVPSADQFAKWTEMRSPRSFAVAWRLSEVDIERLRIGHQAMEMEDKWNVYAQGDTIHFRRSWTGFEVFQFTLQTAPGVPGARISEVVVECDKSIYNVIDIEDALSQLREVLLAIFGVVPTT